MSSTVLAASRGAWREDFEYSGAPDPTTWGVVVDGTFRNRRDNARVENGALVLEVRKDNAEGQTYTSGSLRTADPNSLTYMGSYGDKRYFKPGRLEGRMRLCQVRGLMNSFWLISNWVDTGLGFYTCGEIDMMEAVGYDTDNWYASIHVHRWLDFPNGARDRTTVSAHPYVPNLTADFHTWSAEWDADGVRILYDGQMVLSRAKAGDQAEAYWPFTHDMALVLECGHKPNAYTDWGGEQGTDDAGLPAHMTVEYVRN